MRSWPAVFVFLSLLWPSHILCALTLKEAFEASKKVQASYLNAKLEAEIGGYLKDESLSESLPKIRVFSDHTWQDQVTGSGNTNRFGQSHQHTAALEAEQELFRGGEEIFSVSAASNLRQQLEFQKRDALLDLYRRVANSFYEILRLQTLLNNLQEQAKLLRDRVSLLKERSSIGQSKRTDLINAQSEAARVEAEKIKASIDLERQKKVFEALVGLKLKTELNDSISVGSLEVPEEAEVNDAPKLKALKSAMDLAKDRSNASYSGFLPKVSAGGRYYLDRDGVLADSKWDVGLRAEWEFFSGGRDYSNKRINELRYLQAVNTYSDLLRQEAEIYRAEESVFQMRLKSLKALEASFDLAKKNYEAHQEEFRNGLVSNLDVLQALDGYLAAKQAYDEEAYSLKKSWIELNLLVGRIP